MNSKFFMLFLALAIVGMMSISLVSAANLQISSLEINGRSILDSTQSTVAQNYYRGQNLDVNVCVTAIADVQNAQIYAYLSGYDYALQNPGKVNDMTDTFNLQQNHEQCYDLYLTVPLNIAQDYFLLRISASDRNGQSIDQTYQLYLTGTQRQSAIDITDVSIDPSTVQAGRAFTGQIRIKNLWTSTINDLKVVMSVPALNIQTTQYLNSISTDTSKTFEQLLLRVPDCATPGNYTVNVEVDYDQYSSTDTTQSINVVPGTTCAGSQTTPTGQGLTTINVPSTQEVSQGASTVYPIVITNNDVTDKTYTITVAGASTFATTRLDPSSVAVVPAGQSQTVYLYVSTNPDAQLGSQAFTLTVNSGTESKSVPLITNITQGAAASTSGLKQALEISLVVLVVILIIIGLVIGFNKMKSSKPDNGKDNTEPYY